MAEYIGLKALKTIDEAMFKSVIDNYLGILRSEGNLLFDVRRISYYTGTVYFMCLDKLGLDIKNDFLNPRTIYEQNSVDYSDVDVNILPFDFIENSYARILSEKEAVISDFLSKSKLRPFSDLSADMTP